MLSRNLLKSKILINFDPCMLQKETETDMLLFCNNRFKKKSISIYNTINIATNGNYTLRRLYQKCMKIRQNIELYQYSAAN